MKRMLLSKWSILAIRGVIMLTVLALLISTSGFSQETKLITGTLSEHPNGSPIPGVEIKIKGTQTGTNPTRQVNTGIC